MRQVQIAACLTAMLAASVLTAQDAGRLITTAFQLEQQGRLNEAEEIYTRLYRDDPDNRIAFTRLSEIYIRSGRFDRALDSIEARLEKHPQDASLQTLKGRVLLKLGRRDEAFDLWRRTIENHPRQQPVYIRIANALLEERLPDDAVTIYLTGRNHLKNPAAFAFYLANIHASRMDYSAAAAELLRHLRFNPNQYETVENQLLRLPKNSDDAAAVIAEIRTALEAHPLPARLYLTIAFLYLKMEEPRTALRAVLSCERSDTTHEKGTALYDFARRAFDAGEAGTALQAYRELLALNPRFSRKGEVRFETARCYEALREYGKASDQLALISREHPGSGLAARSLLRAARIEQAERNDPRAAAFCRTLIRTSPESPEAAEARLLLGDLSIAAGEAARADSIFRHILLQPGLLPESRVSAVLLRAQNTFYQKDFSGALEIIASLDSSGLTGRTPLAPSFNDVLSLRLFITQFMGSSPRGLAVFAQAGLLHKQRRFQAALDTLDRYFSLELQEEIGPELTLLQADLLLETDDPAAALNTLALAVQRDPDSAAADRLLVKAARTAMTLHKYDRARSYYEQIIFSCPGSLYVDEARSNIRELTTR